MKFRILSAAALACALAAGAAAAQDDKSKQAAAPKVSGGEREAAQKIEKAKGTEAKLQAAAALVKKYPQSPLRAQAAEMIAAEIGATTDPQAKASLAQAFLDIFNQPDEARYVTGSLLSAYINTGQTQEALKLGNEWLAKHPEDVRTMQDLTILAASEAIKGNNAFMQQGRDLGARAIALLEADKMPEGLDAAKWPEFKKATLASLYRETGVLAFKGDDKAAALPLLEKAIAHGTADPGVYLIVSDIYNNEYELRAKEYQVAAPAERAAAMKRAEEQLDKVIDTYARTIAVTEGNAQYQQANAFLRQGLESYYKYRHKKTDGMQQLIDKYKKPAQ